MVAATTNALGAFHLTFDGSQTVSTTVPNVLVIPQFANYLFELALSARLNGVGLSSRGWVYKGLIVRDPGQSCRLVGSVTQVATWGDSTVGTISIAANTSSNYLQIQATPNQASMAVFFGTLNVTELVLNS